MLLVAKVHGRSVLALPPSLRVGLASLGYVEMEGYGPIPFFRVSRHPELFFTGTKVSIAGSEDVVAQWFGQKATTLPVDDVLQLLAAQLAAAISPVQQMTGTTPRFRSRR